MAYIEIREKKIEGVIFDLDGTLADSIEDIADAMNRVLVKDHRTQEMINHCDHEMRIDYGKNYLVKTRAYDGIDRLVKKLGHEGIKMAVLSNKADEMTQNVVKELFPENTFEVVMGMTETIPRKPDPKGALGISEAMCIDPEYIAYIGDTNTDMQTAKNAGMYAIGAAWGFRTKEELLKNGADIILEHPMDLLQNAL